jgi:hypothetical protein
MVLAKVYSFWMKTSTRIIDYDLKYCMVEQKWKNMISGRYPRFPKFPPIKKTHATHITYNSAVASYCWG